MPEQLKVSNTTSTISLKNTDINQNPKKLGEWTRESSLETKCSTSSRQTTFKSKHSPLPTPLRSCYHRESVLDIRRRSNAMVDDITLINAVKANYRFIYRINDGVGTVNTILQQVCDERGWREFQEEVPGVKHVTAYERAMRSATGWNLWWSYSIYQFSPYKYLRHWQYTNHNPKGFQFCNKLYLTMYLRKMKTIHGSVFDFYPLSYIVPEDYIRLSMEHTKRATESNSLCDYSNLLDPSEVPPSDLNLVEIPPVIITKRMKSPLYSTRPLLTLYPCSDIQFCPVWISKPVGQSQGKGIFVTTDLKTIATDKKSVVQEYICRPLLIAGYKWDVRIYVCVAAIDPLVIYIYQEGLCRFCTEKYKTADLTQTYSHLTNASLNKLSPEYEKDKELIGQGCKWPLRKLRQHFKDHGIPDWYMWQRIMTMVLLTVLGDSLRLGYSASNRNCFDLFGFDVLVDENLKPWLLECNYSPGLGGDSETDEIVKRPMLHELFDLLGFPDSFSYENTGSTESKRSTNPQQNVNSDIMRSPTVASVCGDDTITYDTERLTRHYFELLMEKLKKMNEELSGDKAPANYKLGTSIPFSPEARLMDAKSIYSQNLVVQYLKNQSQGKITHKVREQLITLAAKKLKQKMGVVNSAKKLNLAKRNKSHTPTRVDSGTQYDYQDLRMREEHGISASSTSSKNSLHSLSQSNLKKPRPKSAPQSAVSRAMSASASNLLGALKEEFPHPDSEAFQKLKHYFDAGVDYPMDRKTGKFKECPALLVAKKDWFNPIKQEGGWIRVYPFDARTTKSPYKSSLTDIRQAVRSVESYLKTAEQVFTLNPDESDDFYTRKIKQTCRRDTEVWVPPLTSWAHNKSYFSPPVNSNESNPDCSIDANACCTDQE